MKLLFVLSLLLISMVEIIVSQSNKDQIFCGGVAMPWNASVTCCGTIYEGAWFESGYSCCGCDPNVCCACPANTKCVNGCDWTVCDKSCCE